MNHRDGALVGDYRAPLFLAWQITNRCTGRCLHCCEESGPEKAWSRELSKEEALDVARQTVELGIPYAAFGGGEPMEVPHIWEVFQALRRGGVEIKIETNGLAIDEGVADRLAGLEISCIQISLDGPTAAVHERVRPDGPFGGALAALRRLARRGLAPEAVFVPTRLNLASIVDTLDLAAEAGARTFVTGPLMRLGRAWQSWESLAPSPEEWTRALAELKDRAQVHAAALRLAVYPWDIQHEIRTRLESPQAMVLVVPDGKVKLLNALPFAAGDLRRQTLEHAWHAVVRAWGEPSVRDFAERAAQDPGLLRHANECWDVFPAGVSAA